MSQHDTTRVSAWVKNFTRLETPRLYARPLRADDDQMLFSALDNPRVHGMIAGFPQPFDLSSVRRWMVERLARMDRGDGLYGLVFYQGTETIVGYFGLMVAPEDGSIEIAGALDELYWGKGFAEEFSFALLNDLFDAGVPSVVATTATENYASMRVLQALNFVDEGEKVIVTASGERLSRFYRLTPDAWQKTVVLPANEGLSHADVQARRKELLRLCQDLKSERAKKREG